MSKKEDHFKTFNAWAWKEVSADNDELSIVLFINNTDMDVTPRSYCLVLKMEILLPMKTMCSHGLGGPWSRRPNELFTCLPVYL